MKLLVRNLAVAVLLSAPFALQSQEPRKPDDVLQKRDGGIFVGRVIRTDADSVEILVNGEKEPRKVFFRELNPYSVYRIRLERIDRTSGSARLELAEFCMTTGLYFQAVKEFDEAIRLDPSLEEKARKRREEAHSEDGRAKFEEAKKQAAEKKYEEANRVCQILIEKYGDTPYAEEGRKLVGRIAEDVAKENELRKQQLQAKQEQKEQKLAQMKEGQEKELLAKTSEAIEEAGKLFLEGLDHEPKNLTKAERAWKGAETALLLAKKNLEFLLKSADAETAKKAKDLDAAADAALVRTYYRLGRMWAVELSYPTALEWLNKGLRIPHDPMMDHLYNEVLLTLSQLKMRERAAGRGY